MSKLALTLVALALAACKSSSNSSSNPSDPDKVTYAFKIDTYETNLSDDKRALVSDINSGNAVSFKKITKLLIEENTELNEENALPVGKILETVNAIKPGGNFLEWKTSYESKLEASLNKKIKYNKNALGVSDIVRDGKLQCYSGTVFNLLVGRETFSGTDYRQQNFVLIFEEGHVLPGIVVKKDGEFHLQGVETTATGAAVKSYGATKSLNKPLMIIDAEEFAVLQIFRNDLKDAPQAAVDSEDRTAKKYDIPVEKLRELRNTGEIKNKHGNVLNVTLFGFGVSNLPEGDQERGPLEGGGSGLEQINSESVFEKNVPYVAAATNMSFFARGQYRKVNEHPFHECPADVLLIDDSAVHPNCLHLTTPNSSKPVEQWAGENYLCAFTGEQLKKFEDKTIKIFSSKVGSAKAVAMEEVREVVTLGHSHFRIDVERTYNLSSEYFNLQQSRIHFEFKEDTLIVTGSNREAHGREGMTWFTNCKFRKAVY